MVKKKALTLIIIISIIIASLLILVIPFQKTTLYDSETVPYSAAIQQVNVMANLGEMPVNINYALDPNSDLINFTYVIKAKYGLTSEPPSVSVVFDNFSLGDTLTIIISLNYTVVSRASIYYTQTFITINPNLLSNISVFTTSGDIEFNTRHYEKKDIIFLDLNAHSGSINALITNQCNITGLSQFTTLSGSNQLTFNGESAIYNNLSMSSISGDCSLSLEDNVTITRDLNIWSANGSISFTSSNISLNNNDLNWQFTIYDGAIQMNITQRTSPAGNISCLISNIYGEIRFGIGLEADNISSNIEATASLGGIVMIDPYHPGYVATGSGLDSAAPERNCNFDAIIGTFSGIIYVNATRL
jgi:hypothetical protein